MARVVIEIDAADDRFRIRSAGADKNSCTISRLGEKEFVVGFDLLNDGRRGRGDVIKVADAPVDRAELVAEDYTLDEARQSEGRGTSKR